MMLKKKYYTGLQIHEAIDGVVGDYKKAIEIYRRLAKMETDDVQPVKHGEWILLPSELVSDDGLWGETRYACSNCGYERHVKYEFCPKCGAMMDGKEQKSYADWVVKRE